MFVIHKHTQVLRIDEIDIPGEGRVRQVERLLSLHELGGERAQV